MLTDNCLLPIFLNYLKLAVNFYTIPVKWNEKSKRITPCESRQALQIHKFCSVIESIFCVILVVQFYYRKNTDSAIKLVFNLSVIYFRCHSLLATFSYKKRYKEVLSFYNGLISLSDEHKGIYHLLNQVFI